MSRCTCLDCLLDGTFPAPAIPDPIDRLASDAKFSAENSVAITTTSDFGDLIRSKFGDTQRRPRAPLIDRVVCVVGVGPKKHVFWVHACADIATVTNEEPTGDWPDENPIYVAVCAMVFSRSMSSISGLELPVAGVVDCAAPQPATAHWLGDDPVPKPIGET